MKKRILNKTVYSILVILFSIILLETQSFAEVATSAREFRPRPIVVIWRIAKTFIIPIALVIGLIIYLKKSKSSTKKKIIVSIISITSITIIILLCLLINSLI